MWLKMRFGEERKPRTTFHQGTFNQISHIVASRFERAEYHRRCFGSTVDLFDLRRITTRNVSFRSLNIANSVVILYR